MARGQKGWYIGGKSINGDWKWSDGTNMDYMNFPSSRPMAVDPNSQVINYAAIFKDGDAYNWDYVTSRETDLGYVCEYDHC